MLTRQQRTIGVLVFGGAGCVFAAMIGVAVVAAGPSPTDPKKVTVTVGPVALVPNPHKSDLPLGKFAKAEAWDYARLVEHLRANGFPEVTTVRSFKHKPAMWITLGERFDGGSLDAMPISAHFNHLLARDMGASFDWQSYRRTLAEDEKPYLFGWRNFLFKSEPVTLAKVAKRLTN